MNWLVNALHYCETFEAFMAVVYCFDAWAIFIIGLSSWWRAFCEAFALVFSAEQCRTLAVGDCRDKPRLEACVLNGRLVVCCNRWSTGKYRLDLSKCLTGSPAMSQLKQLVLGEDSPPLSPSESAKGFSWLFSCSCFTQYLSVVSCILCLAVGKDEPANLIFEEKELEKTPLGDAIDSLMVRWAQLLSNVSTRPPVPAPSTIDHVKEVVEISMYHVG